jgi:hypothetical protein
MRWTNGIVLSFIAVAMVASGGFFFGRTRPVNAAGPVPVAPATQPSVWEYRVVSILDVDPSIREMGPDMTPRWIIKPETPAETAKRKAAEQALDQLHLDQRARWERAFAKQIAMAGSEGFEVCPAPDGIPPAVGALSDTLIWLRRPHKG